MDPCPFVKVLVGGLALRIPVASKPTRAGIHFSRFPCFCEIKFDKFPVQIAAVPLIYVDAPAPDVQNLVVSFHLEHSELVKLSMKYSCLGVSNPQLDITVYTGRQGSNCGMNLGKVLGKFSVPLDLEGAHERLVVFHNGWVSIGKSSAGDSKAGPQLHLNVRAEPDSRFVSSLTVSPSAVRRSCRFRAIFSNQFSAASLAATGILDHDRSNVTQIIGAG